MAREILGLDPALGIEAEFMAALDKARAQGVALVGVMRTAHQPGFHEARFCRTGKMNSSGKVEDYFTASRADDCEQPAGEWLTEMTDEAIKALAAS